MKILYNTSEAATLIGISERHLKRLSDKYGINAKFKNHHALKWTLLQIEEIKAKLEAEPTGRPEIRGKRK